MKCGVRRKFNDDKKVSIYEKFDGHCAYCGCHLDWNEYTIDHIIPLVNQGSNKGRNLVPCCFDCNTYKGSDLTEHFREKLYELFNKKILSEKEKRLKEKYGLYKPHRITFYYEKLEKQQHQGDHEHWLSLQKRFKKHYF